VIHADDSLKMTNINPAEDEASKSPSHSWIQTKKSTFKVLRNCLEIYGVDYSGIRKPFESQR